MSDPLLKSDQKMLRIHPMPFLCRIGGWSYALRLAGWGDDRPIWSGSCPAKVSPQRAHSTAPDDPRHLWPTW